ncbi:unnamed protein product [Trichogramma brassicae]|uniref:Laminin EGF-like domain-containing protein n=1 Tax=Trichogramma brassicae TaxID=86971 RepID=A0A6H5IWA8_9HYME|nr:unnamed protein product [Trichogramma brassicae]
MNFDTLVNSASERVTRRLQGFIEYFRRFWLQSVGPINFSVFGIHTRTNNAIESYHSELLHRLGEHPPLWRWIGKIIKIQEKQWSDVDTMERGRSVRRQPKNTTMFRNFELQRGNGRRRRRQRRRARVGPMFGQRLFAAVDHIAVHQNDVMEAQEVPYVAPLAVDIVANVQRPPIEVEVPAAAVVANPIHDNDQLDIIGNNDQMVGDVVVNVQRPPIEVEVPTAAVVANPIHDNDQLDIIGNNDQMVGQQLLASADAVVERFPFVEEQPGPAAAANPIGNDRPMVHHLQPVADAVLNRPLIPARADLSLHGGNNDETYAHMQITNLRVNLSEFPAELESDKKPDGAYYAIGLHSSHCLGSEMDLDMWGQHRICEHNTVGKYCEQCKSQYRDAPWRRAQGSKTNACQACRCNGYSRQCRFDARLYEKTGCGGVCEN